MASTFKRILVGPPIASSEAEHQALGKPTALAVFASDAISSTAYATEEILFVLLAAATFPQTHRYLVPIAVVSVLLLVLHLQQALRSVYASALRRPVLFYLLESLLLVYQEFYNIVEPKVVSPFEDEFIGSVPDDMPF